MGFLFLVLIVLLIAQIGFWNALGAILGAVAMVILLAILGVAVLIVGGVLLVAASLK